MIPIYKLDRLPRMQKLRKIAKYFAMAEKRLFEFVKNNTNNSNKNPEKIFTISELQFFLDSVRLLAKDELFSEDVRKLFKEAINIFETSVIEEFLRTLNNIKHILFSVTGTDTADWDFTTNTGSLNSDKRKVFAGMQVYLEDIRSPFNVGAMFRTAESFGVEKIILSPFCADPRHRRAERTAMGCIDIVPWERQELFLPNNQFTNDFPVFALETGGTLINKFQFPNKGILIAGSEELGVSPRALEMADLSLGRVSIPIYGAKASLNVSTAFGIALQYWAGFLALN